MTTGESGTAGPPGTAGYPDGRWPGLPVVARRVQACPDVVRLVQISGREPTGGPGEAGPGEDDGALGASDLVVVRAVCRYGPTMAELTAQIRAAVLTVAPRTRKIDVLIDDLDMDVPAWAGVT